MSRDVEEVASTDKEASRKWRAPLKSQPALLDKLPSDGSSQSTHFDISATWPTPARRRDRRTMRNEEDKTLPTGSEPC